MHTCASSDCRLMISATISSSGAIASRSALRFSSSHCSAAWHPDVASGVMSGACTDAAPDAAGSDAWAPDAAAPPPGAVSAADTATDPASDAPGGPSSSVWPPPAPPCKGSDFAGAGVAAAFMDVRLLARGLNGRPRELVACCLFGRAASASPPASSSILMLAPLRVGLTGEPWWEGRPRFRVLRRCCMVKRSGRSSDSMPLASAARPHRQLFLHLSRKAHAPPCSCPCCLHGKIDLHACRIRGAFEPGA